MHIPAKTTTSGGLTMGVDTRPANESRGKCLTENAGRLTSPRYPQRYVYFVGPENGPVKIGTAFEPVARVAELQTGNAEHLWFWAVCEGGLSLERTYHEKFAADRIRGEWFARTPALEREMKRLCRRLKFTVEGDARTARLTPAEQPSSEGVV